MDHDRSSSLKYSQIKVQLQRQDLGQKSAGSAILSLFDWSNSNVELEFSCFLKNSSYREPVHT